MSLDTIKKLVGSLTKSIDDNEKIAVPVLTAKLAKYATVYPHDSTIGSMLNIMEKMR